MKCYITGWGHLSEENNRVHAALPHMLQEARVRAVVRAECADKYRSVNRITRRMFCMTGETPGGEVVDACQGDSGGPLVCEHDGAWFLH